VRHQTWFAVTLLMMLITASCGYTTAANAELEGCVAWAPMTGEFGARCGTPGRREIDLSYSDFIARVDNNEVRDVTLIDSTAVGTLTAGKQFRTVVPDDPELIARLIDHRVEVRATPADRGSALGSILIESLVVLMLVAAMIRAQTLQQRSSERAHGFGRSRARLATEAAPRTTFQQVAGVDEAKQDLCQSALTCRNTDLVRPREKTPLVSGAASSRKEASRFLD